MPLHVIIAAAKTVSRARVEASSPPDTMSVTIKPTSMTVTATARISEPNGSPTRWATTSAWCTAASTAPPSRIATRTRTTVPGFRPHVSTRARAASAGTAVVQSIRGRDRVTGRR
jgi:hypothetical protein